jgi:hypothetical protein
MVMSKRKPIGGRLRRKKRLRKKWFKYYLTSSTCSYVTKPKPIDWAKVRLAMEDLTASFKLLSKSVRNTNETFKLEMLDHIKDIICKPPSIIMKDNYA